MELKQNPFSVYDFLGYFTPGAILIYGSLAAYAHANKQSIFDTLSNSLSFDKAEVYIPFVLAAYVIGHIVSFLSSITIEKYSIWQAGYPSKYLMGLKIKNYFELGRTDKPKWLYVIGRLLLALLVLPITVCDIALSLIPGRKGRSSDNLDPLIRAIVWKKLIHLLSTHGGLDAPPQEGGARTHNYFLYAYHYALENAPTHVPKMQNYVALYGFLRALSFLSLIAFWSIFVHIVTQSVCLLSGLILMLPLIILTYLLYMGFIKFYRRYSLEVLMAMAISVEISK